MTHEWGMLIVVYLFLGGLSAGLLTMSAALTVFVPSRFERIASRGAALAPWPVLAGTGLLVVDLGQPLYFWKLLVAFAPRSPMWIGTWLLTAFAALSIAYAWTFLPAWLLGGDRRRLLRRRRRLAATGLPIGLGVGFYTGVLLGVLVARPLWNTPLLPQLFLISAVSSGAALLLIVLRRSAGEEDRRILARSDAILIALELVVIAAMFLEAATSPVTAAVGASLLTAGLYGWTFWVGVVLLGLVVPLLIELAELAGVRTPSLHRLAALAPVLVLAGGFFLRWVLVYAGQASRLG